jgi:hypothetical protein
MSNISGNTCSVVTILPLGVDCYSVNATTPVSNDGAIYLTITGGSTPYNITWDNELKTNNIYNLYPGSYTVTIVDYYGDYSATTTCEVGSDSFYLDYFQSCSASTFAYFTGLTESQLNLGGVYKFENTQGCWTYSGKTLYTGQTYTGDVLSVYYETCEDCNPQTVTPYYPITLCLYSTSCQLEVNTYISWRIRVAEGNIPLLNKYFPLLSSTKFTWADLFNIKLDMLHLFLHM